MSSQSALMAMTFSLILGQLVILAVSWRIGAWVQATWSLSEKATGYAMIGLAISFVVVLIHLDAWILDQLEVAYSVEQRAWLRYAGLPCILGCLWSAIEGRSSMPLVVILGVLVSSFAVWTGVAALVLPLGWWSPLVQLGVAGGALALSSFLRPPARDWGVIASVLGGYHGMLFVFYVQVMSDSPADWPHALALVDGVYSWVFYFIVEQWLFG